MAVVIEVTFPLGRYHATPWDRHVNEGVVEWPPSAWRLARALFSVWKDRAPHLDIDTVYAALEAISAPPTYWVPPVTEMATRHMYPDPTYRSGMTKPATDKILDGSVVLGPDRPLYIGWDSDPSPAAAAALDELLDLLPYLGRADSICIARRRTDASVPDLPGYQQLEPGGGADLVLPSPRRPLDFNELTITTDAMRRALLPRPPGAVWTAYAAPDQLHPQPTALAAARPEPTAVLLSLSGRPLPPYTLAAAVGDVAAKAATRRFFQIHQQLSQTLSGHAEDGDPLRDAHHQHRHAHYLPLPDRPPGTQRAARVDRVLVWAPNGLSADEIDVIAGISSLSPHTRQRNSPNSDASSDPRRSAIHGFDRVRCMIAAIGQDDILQTAGLARPAQKWRPLTPFATVRHEHRRRYGPQQIGPYSLGFIEEEILRELRHRQLPEATVSAAPDTDPPVRYWHRRSTAPLAKSLPAIWVNLEFDRPVSGPIALGALSHYGLGLFSPVE